MADKTILVVDDDEAMVRTLSIGLKTSGYKVFVAMDGMQAVMMSYNRKPDLLVLDIRMPAGGGFNVMEKLRGSIKTSKVPVIVISAEATDENRQKADELGAVRFFEKPFDIHELLEAIKEALPE